MLFPRPTEAQAREVLARFLPGVCPIALVCLMNQDGFSGAVIWRVDAAGGRFCLKAWPPGEASPERLARIHDWMLQARGSGLDFVPAVYATSRERLTCVECGARIWELTEWMLGTTRSSASRSEIECSCTALARLHRLWAALGVAHASCPAIAARLERADACMKLVAGRWRVLSESISAGDELDQHAVRGWDLVCRHIDHVVHGLRPWLAVQLNLHPCIGDLRAEHVLFNGDRLSGIVDFGAARMDHGAVDLARLLGSLAGDVSSLRKAGLEAYRAVRSLSLQEEALVHILDHSGAVLAVASWVMWIYEKGRPVEDRPRVARRLSDLVQRIEGWDRGC